MTMNIHEALSALDQAPHWLVRRDALKRWRDEGIHTGKLIGELIAERVAAKPDVPVIFGSREHPDEATATELLQESYKTAAAFRALGLVEGDVLVAQTPNWKEGLLTLLASMHLGLIYVPMVHIMGAPELSFVINTTGAKALVLPDRWKKIDYGARVGGLESVPSLQNIIVIGEAEMPVPVIRWSELDYGAPADLPPLKAKPDDAWLVMFTSGTTAAPKGVVHSHHSFATEIGLFPSSPSPTGRPKFHPLPGGHSAGMIAALRPFLAGDSSLMMDAFEEELAIELIKKHRPDRGGGVPMTLTILLDRADELFPNGVVQMTVGAASVPPSLMARCEAAGWPATRTYGSTEHPTICGGFPPDPFVKRANTDGRLLKGVEVRLVDDEGNEVVVGEPGEIVSMGPELFKGYLDPAHNEAAFAEDGWFHTGDIGRMDEDGYLAIVDRKKDIIIRGGENISSKEVEDLLMRHPRVTEVAAVAWPDAKLGERVGVFVRLSGAADLTIEEVQQHFADAGIARQKTPERIVIIDDFPRTPAGKILKTELRQRVLALTTQEGAVA